MNKTVVGVALVAATLAAVSGCAVGADHDKGVGDAGVQKSRVNEIKPNKNQVGQQNDPASVIVFSDGFANIEFKCNGVDGIYVNTRKDGFFVVQPNDPQCN